MYSSKCYFLRAFYFFSILFFVFSFYNVSHAETFTISNCVELQAIDNTVTLGNIYELTQDIDCSDTINWNEGAGFDPIGDDSMPFRGTFDGNGFEISDLYINLTGGEYYIALFGSTINAAIYDVGVVDFDFNGCGRVGGLIGYSIGGSGIVYNSYATGQIECSEEYSGLIGGLVADVSGGSIEKSYADVDIVGGNASAGGFVGQDTFGSTISNSYALGDVSSDDTAGGFLAVLIGNVQNVYSTGNVSATTSGGLIGVNAGGSVTNSFYNSQTSGKSDTGNGEPKTTLQMRQSSTFTDATWDFDEVWGILEGQTYPYLFDPGIEIPPPDTDPPVIVEVEPIDSKTTIEDAVYYFTVSESCDIYTTAIETTSEQEAELFFTDTSDTEITHEAYINGLEIGETYSFEFYCVDSSDNESNILSVGPFTVKSNNVDFNKKRGTSIQGRVNNLIKIGNTELAQQLMNKYPNLFTKETNKNIQSDVQILDQKINKFLFKKDLKNGMVDDDVRELQKILNSLGYIVAVDGPGSLGEETNLFGEFTQNALIRFQKDNGINPAIGFLGPITREFLNR